MYPALELVLSNTCKQQCLVWLGTETVLRPAIIESASLKGDFNNLVFASRLERREHSRSSEIFFLVSMFLRPLPRPNL